MRVSFEQQASKVSQFLNPSYFLFQLRIHCQVEIIIYLSNLGDILILHLPPSQAFPAWLICFWEYYLVNDDIMNVDVKLCKLNSKSFCFIQT